MQKTDANHKRRLTAPEKSAETSNMRFPAPEKIQKGHKSQRYAKTAPDSEHITIQLIMLVKQRINRRKEAVNQTVNNPKHTKTSRKIVLRNI